MSWITVDEPYLRSVSLNMRNIHELPWTFTNDHHPLVWVCLSLGQVPPSHKPWNLCQMLSKFANIREKRSKSISRKFTIVHETLSYANFNSLGDWTAISRFPCSSHNLAIELGRHAKPKKIELAKRVCKKCNVLEDEMHHVTACTLNSKQREHLYSEVLKYEPNFLSYSNQKKFKFILQTREKKLLKLLVCFYISRTLLLKFWHHAVEYFVKFIV